MPYGHTAVVITTRPKRLTRWQANYPKSGGRRRLALPKKYNRTIVYLLLKTSPKSVKLFQGNTEIGRFTKSRGNSYTLIFEDGRPVDLLPFGAISMEGAVNIVGHGLTNIRVDGFEEVFEVGTEIVTVNGRPFRVCTLVGIVILKLMLL